MSKEDFLKNLDQQLSVDEQSRQQSADRAAKLKARREKISAAAKPILESWKADLEKRGITAKVTSVGEFLSFELLYAQGGHYGFELNDSGFGTTFTENGQNYRSSAGYGEVADSLDRGALDTLVQKTIQDFLIYAPKYGGYRCR